MPTKSVYLLAGDEAFLKEEWLKNTRQQFFKEEENRSCDFNLFFADEDADIPAILAIARTSPFLAKKRLIVLKSIEGLTSPAHQEQLLSYANSPSPHAIFVLEADIKPKAIAQDKFISQLSRVSEVVLFKKLYDATLSNWITKRFLIQKKRATPQAVEFLKELKGNNLKELDNEVQKLATYAGTRPTVTAEDVGELVGKDIKSNVSDILDAISQNDKKKALVLGLDLQEKNLGNAIGLLCWNLRKLLRMREYLKQGWPPQKIADALELKKFQLDRFVPQAKRLKVSWMKQAILELTEFDLKIKTSGFDGSLAGWDVLMAKLLALL